MHYYAQRRPSTKITWRWCRVHGQGVTCCEVWNTRTPNGHGLSNNVVAAFRECPLILSTVRTQRDSYAETERDQKPFLDAKKPAKNRKNHVFGELSGIGMSTIITIRSISPRRSLKEKLGPNSTWSRRKSQKTPKNSNRRIDRNEKVLKLQTGFGSRQCGHFALSDAC